MSSFAPKSHLTAPIWNWAPYYTKVVEQVKNGTWKAESAWPGLKEGIVALAPFGPMVPQQVQDRVKKAEGEIIGGRKIFTGPIKDQQGKVKIGAGTKATDGELLGMTWFVEGVVGTTE